MRCFITVFIFLLALSNVNAASYFNEDYEESNFVYFDHFYVRKVKADRALCEGSGITGLIGDALTEEEEDKWKIHYSFTVDVTDFEMRWDALDGQNDNDQRSYTDTRDDRDAGDEYNIEHSNFPTYVDNMKIRIKYTYNGQRYEHQFFIYVEDEGNKGSSPLAVDSEIPEEYQETDAGGTFGSGGSIEGAIESVTDAANPFDNIDMNFLDELPEKILNFFVTLIIGVLLIKLAFAAFSNMSAPAVVGGCIFLLLGVFFIVGAFTIIFGIVNNFISLLQVLMNALKSLNPL